MTMVHFIGFKPTDTDRIANAIRIWGKPDFVHQKWDHRAKSEILNGDVAVFAKGGADEDPVFYPYTQDEFYGYLVGRTVKDLFPLY